MIPLFNTVVHNRGMEGLEHKSRVGRRKATVQKAILTTLAVSGILTVGLLAPNAFGLLGSFGLTKRNMFNSRLTRSLRGLLERKYVEFVGDKGSRKLRITDAGRLYLYSTDTSGYVRKIPKRWDKKWRVVIFDIKESLRITRDKVRRQLVSLGFMRLQNSVWVYPYDCEEIITLIKLDKHLGVAVLYMIVDQIEFDRPIREFFGLPAK